MATGNPDYPNYDFICGYADGGYWPDTNYAVIGTDANGNNVTLRYAAATQQFSAQLGAWVDAAEVVWSDGFETPDLQAIFG